MYSRKEEINCRRDDAPRESPTSLERTHHSFDYRTIVLKRLSSHLHALNPSNPPTWPKTLRWTCTTGLRKSPVQRGTACANYRPMIYPWPVTHAAQFKLLKDFAAGCIHVCLFGITAAAPDPIQSHRPSMLSLSYISSKKMSEALAWYVHHTPSIVRH